MRSRSLARSRACPGLWLPVFLWLTLGLLAGSTARPSAAAEDAAPLSPRGRANLEALARLAAVVRFFHPSDGVAQTDWNAFVAGSIERVEAAPDDAALARLLGGRMRPLAPTVQVFLAGSPPPPPAGFDRPAKRFHLVMWRHYGVKLEGAKRQGMPADSGKLWLSDRIDDRAGYGFGDLSQQIDAAALRGRTVRLTAWARAEPDPSARAELWLRVERGEGKPSVLQRMAEDGISSPTWRSYDVETEVPPDAVGLTLGLLLTGGGHAWLDEVQLTAGDQRIALANPAFEVGELARQPPGWDFPYSSIRAGYRLALRRGGDCFRGGCAEVVADPLATPRFPLPSEVEELDLGSGLRARVPRSLWADDQGTGQGTWPRLTTTAGSLSSPSPRGERLAAVALAWGVLQHFYPYFAESGGDWAATLGPALAEAAVAAEPEAFRRALRRMLAGLGDANSGAIAPSASPAASLPLAWEWIEGNVVITALAEEAGRDLAVGDVVSRLDDRPIAEVLAETEELVSAPSPAARRLLALDELLVGPPGATRRLAVARAGSSERHGAPREVEIAFSRPLGVGPVAARGEVAELAPGVLYLDLRRLDDAKLEALLPRLEKARGLVLDARGLVDVGTILLSHLADREVLSAAWGIPVVTRPDRQDVESLGSFWTIGPKPPRLTAKTAFLIDRRTYAYAETLLTMVEGRRLGRLVGEPTAGNLGMVNHIPLPGGWQVLFTGSRATKIDGSRLYGVGVLPEVRATRTLAGVRAGRDEVIDAGLAAVR